MHIFFSGIGGTGIGPLALIAHQAGYQVSGSDKKQSSYIDYLHSKGINDITIGQSEEDIAKVHAQNPIDMLVYSSAVSIENPDHPELVFAREHDIKTSKRDELLNQIIADHNLKLIAVAGTHGKTTTTAMVVWLFKQLGLPLSYSVGAKISFGDMGHFDPKAEYFAYEADEFDRNFLAFEPYLSLITGIDYDHHEIFPTREDYEKAFSEFIQKSERTVMWPEDANKIGVKTSDSNWVIKSADVGKDKISLLGEVNRQDAWLVAVGLNKNGIGPEDLKESVKILEQFPGLSRRFEKIKDNLYSDYAHTVPKIKGCLQLAEETGKNIVVIYEPLTNRRQHYIQQDYKDLFRDVKKLYWVPSYLTREDPNQHVLAPTELIKNMDNPRIAESAELDDNLQKNIQKHLETGDLVVCISGGGGGSLDEWLRQEFQ